MQVQPEGPLGRVQVDSHVPVGLHAPVLPKAHATKKQLSEQSDQLHSYNDFRQFSIWVS